MIQITTRRFGPIVVAGTANDYRDITFAIGLTDESARRRLCRTVSR
jgi:hypothetical protein